MKHTYHYYEYEVDLYSDPSRMEMEESIRLIEQMNYVNRKAKTNLEYGIFDKSLSLTDKIFLMSNMSISLMRIAGEPVGFTYQYILDQKVQDKAIVHQGLLVAHKNPGRDVSIFNFISSMKLRERLGDFYTTCLASAPFAIGAIAKVFSEVWPSPYGNQKVPPCKSYKEVANVCYERYVKPFFPYPENLTLDTRRFVVVSKAQEMGFEVDMRAMSRDEDLMANLFCMFWLNYEAQEIMMQIGLCDERAVSVIQERMKEHKVQI